MALQGSPGWCTSGRSESAEVDAYNTQSAIALVRQHIDYAHWFDLSKEEIIAKNIRKVQYISCMNNTAGSFEVNPRLQRHFATFAVGFPGPTSLLTIYQTFLDGHLKKFASEVQQLSSNLINAALVLHTGCVKAFRKTAKNFHYEFNLRHLSNVFQGLLSAIDRFDEAPKSSSFGSMSLSAYTAICSSTQMI